MTGTALPAAAPPHIPGSPAVLRLLRSTTAMTVCSPLMALAAWEAAARLGWISVDAFTSPVQVAWALKEIALGKNAALRGSLMLHVLTSIQEVGLGNEVPIGASRPLSPELFFTEGFLRVKRRTFEAIQAETRRAAV